MTTSSVGIPFGLIPAFLNQDARAPLESGESLAPSGRSLLFGDKGPGKGNSGTIQIRPQMTSLFRSFSGGGTTWITRSPVSESLSIYLFEINAQNRPVHLGFSSPR